MSIWTWDGSRLTRLDDDGQPSSPGWVGLFWAGLAAAWTAIAFDIRRCRR